MVSVRSLPPLRIAIEGCYPSFQATDLVMRAFGVLCSFNIVARSRPHDLLIRGPFSDGSSRLRLINRALGLRQSLLRHEPPVTLHVSSENPFADHYQGFEDSGCHFGLGHEIRVGDDRYCRVPHWWNYVDFSEQGIPSPAHWIRLGEPMQQDQLLRPLEWNATGKNRAAFVASYVNAQRQFLMTEVNKVLPVDGFGRAFDSSVANHSCSGFTKRQLLAEYQYGFCPENAIAPGYYTEKIPECFACGAIPVAYADRHIEIDFNPESFINVYDYLSEGVASGLQRALLNSERIDLLLSTPLLKREIPIEGLLDFLKLVLAEAKAC